MEQRVLPRKIDRVPQESCRVTRLGWQGATFVLLVVFSQKQTVETRRGDRSSSRIYLFCFFCTEAYSLIKPFLSYMCNMFLEGGDPLRRKSASCHCFFFSLHSTANFICIGCENKTQHITRGETHRYTILHCH